MKTVLMGIVSVLLALGIVGLWRTERLERRIMKLEGEVASLQPGQLRLTR